MTVLIIQLYFMTACVDHRALLYGIVLIIELYFMTACVDHRAMLYDCVC